MSRAVVELDADHPGFNDADYRRRRDEIATLAANHQPGEPPPYAEYNELEHRTWGTIFDKLTELYPTHACREYNQVFADIGHTRERIPQLRDVSRFLQQRTGFRLEPVAGLVSARAFLGALADGVFCCTQYIRHHSRPLYTPEPDIGHELMGHAPMLAIPEFADLSRTIGEGSRGASDELIEQLATLYWFTVEFGLVRQGGDLKAYGAGLLSSFGELEHALSGAVEVRPFDPAAAAVTTYPITSYQPLLWEVGEIGDAFERIVAWLSERGRG